MKIIKAEIKNFKNIENISAELDGNSLWIIGKNGTGKSSFIQALFSPLTGKDFPQQPLKQGAHKGNIKIEIGEPGNIEYIVEVKFTESDSKGKLTVTIPGSIKPENKPRTLLDNIIGNITFDPFAFIRLLQKEPKKAIEEIKKICGINFDEIDNEYKESFEERTLINRDIKNLEGRLNAFNIPMEYMNNENLEKIDTNELLVQKDKYSKIVNHIFQLEQDNARNISNIETTKNEIQNLEIKLKAAKERLVLLNCTHNDSLSIYNTEKKERDAFNIEDINNKLQNAEPHNELVNKCLEAKKVKTELIEKIFIKDNLTEKLEELTEKKKNILQLANIPVKGLEFGEDMLYIDGLPLTIEQMNTAKIVEVGYKLGSALHKEMNIMRIDGSLLDTDTLNEFIKFAENNGDQIFIEKVDNSAEDLRLEFIEK